MLISSGAAVVAIVLSLMSIFIAKEIRGHKQNNEIFKMQKVPVYSMLILAMCMGFTSIFILIEQPLYRLHPSDASAPAVIGIGAVVCALIWTFYEVRIEDDYICFGLRARVRLGYSEISKIVDIRNQGSPRAELVTNSGKRIKIWSNLLGYENLILELRARCNCTYIKLEKRGQKE